MGRRLEAGSPEEVRCVAAGSVAEMKTVEAGKPGQVVVQTVPDLAGRRSLEDFTTLSRAAAGPPSAGSSGSAQRRHPRT